VGASSTGKTALGAALADRLGPAVGLCSVDALAVYREMDIGTAKPTRPADPASRHPWALVDLVDPDEEFSVAEFQLAARSVVAGLHEGGRAVVFVGGTGLYHRAVVDDLTLPGRYPAVAARLAREAEEPGGLERLHARLFEADPVAASRMEPGNSRRIVRALEVVEGSGRGYSEFGPGLGSYEPSSTLTVGLSLERSELDDRLAARLEAQLAEGFLEEVGALLARPRPLSRSAGQAIGYRELASHLQGECTLAEARGEILRRLRNFARRQESWFRRDPRIVWLPATGSQLLDDVLELWETRRS
jgi:tRNA dimethylallyltransferase